MTWPMQKHSSSASSAVSNDGPVRAKSVKTKLFSVSDIETRRAYVRAAATGQGEGGPNRPAPRVPRTRYLNVWDRPPLYPRGPASATSAAALYRTRPACEPASRSGDGLATGASGGTGACAAGG